MSLRANWRSALSGIRREVNSPELRTGFDELQRGSVSFFVNANDAALQVSLRVKVRQKDSLLRNHAGLYRHEGAMNAYVNGFGTFGKRLTLQRAIEKDARVQSHSVSAALSEVAVVRCRPRCISDGPAKKMPLGSSGDFTVCEPCHGRRLCWRCGLLGTGSLYGDDDERRQDIGVMCRKRQRNVYRNNAQRGVSGGG